MGSCHVHVQTAGMMTFLGLGGKGRMSLSRCRCCRLGRCLPPCRYRGLALSSLIREAGKPAGGFGVGAGSGAGGRLRELLRFGAGALGRENRRCWVNGFVVVMIVSQLDASPETKNGTLKLCSALCLQERNGRQDCLFCSGPAGI
jgi:hypothetical protein